MKYLVTKEVVMKLVIYADDEEHAVEKVANVDPRDWFWDTKSEEAEVV